MREVTPNEMRKLQLELLDDVHSYCLKHNIRYSLAGGTLLGAIRHKGFIPWDDDIDILMPRPDYERFIAQYDGSAYHHTSQTYKNSFICGVPFCKVYDTRTVLYEGPIKNGVFIDVFPIDGIPAKEHLNAYVDELMRLLRLNGKTMKFYLYKGGWLMKLKYVIKSFIYPSHEKIMKVLDDFFNQYPFDTAQYAGGLVGSYPQKEHMSADVYREYIDVSFEGKIYKGLKDYDTYLSILYGDYMKLPPVEQQQGHHFVEAYWLE